MTDASFPLGFALQQGQPCAVAEALHATNVAALTGLVHMMGFRGVGHATAIRGATQIDLFVLERAV
ncbi:MAG: hypothetical protein WCK17_19580 [Verrucomicrobiota bacterium]